MRRGITWLAVVAMVATPLIAIAASGDDYADQFKAVSYSGSDGDLDWSSKPWQEVGDDGSASGGKIHVGSETQCSTRCIHMDGNGILPVSMSVARKADLSMFASALLEYDLTVASSVSTVGALVVEVRGKGLGWVPVKTYAMPVSGGKRTESVNITAYIGSDFEVRFSLLSLLSGDVYIDNVVLDGTYPPTTTTSTTSSTTTTTLLPTTTSSLPVTIPTIGTTTTTSPTTTSTGRGNTTTSSTSTTTTTIGSTTTTSVGGGAGEGTTTIPPIEPGVRQSDQFVMVDFQSGLMGELPGADIEVLSAGLGANFSLAAEVFDAAEIWIAGLALLMAAAVIAGMDWHRSKKQPLM